MTFSRFLFITVFFFRLWIWPCHSPSLSWELGEIGSDRYLGIVLILSMGLHWERGFGNGNTWPLRWIGGFWSIMSSRHHVTADHGSGSGLEFREPLNFWEGFGFWTGQGLGSTYLGHQARDFAFCFFPSFSLSLTGHGWVGRHGTVRSWFGWTHMD
jgi:hypothetical protein